ncbi:hypothetical protein GOV14_04195 [Candidatus Pacearchaeota archaeon]|nr:hypothetical protein [Candidatus Pacearchaeota archaeon]
MAEGYDETRTLGYILENGCDDSERELKAIYIVRSFSEEGYTQHEAFEKLTKWSETKLITPLDKVAIEDCITKGFGRASQYRNDSVIEEYHLNDVGNAKRLVDFAGEIIRYNYVWKKWFLWNGKVWEEDRTGGIERLGKEMLVGLYSLAPTLRDEERKPLIKHVLSSESKLRIMGMIDLSRSEPGIPVTPDELDSHKNLFNINNGMLDLNTCELLPFKKENLITKTSPVNYDKSAKCPKWDKFIKRIFAGDQDLINYVQKALAYSLTGEASEKSMFILWGVGDTGKTTLTNTITHIFGDYCKEIPSKELIVKKFNNNSNDWARLYKTRLVRSSENKKGQTLDIGAIKAVTGGGKFPCRALYHETEDMDIYFALWLETNYKPRVPDNDDAIWNRLKLIPFTVQFSKEEIIDKYWDVLIKEELPGIFNWLLAGLKLWRKEGLKNLPNAVKLAIEDYRTDEDILGEFINLKYDYVNRSLILLKEIYSDYKFWCQEVGFTPFSSKRLKSELVSRGHKATNQAGTNLILIHGLAPVDVIVCEGKEAKVENPLMRGKRKKVIETPYFTNTTSQNEVISYVIELIKEGGMFETNITTALQSTIKISAGEALKIIQSMEDKEIIIKKPSSEYMIGRVV